jgi:S1-C subfamily serine protease
MQGGQDLNDGDAPGLAQFRMRAVGGLRDEPLKDCQMRQHARDAMIHPERRRRWPASFAACLLTLSFVKVVTPVQAQAVSTIERVKASIVAVGTFQRTRQPQFRFLGTGFAVGDGNVIATNGHVLPPALEGGSDPESLVIVVPARDAAQRIVREARPAASSLEHDLALLRIDGRPLAALRLGDSERVRDGETYLFTGFPVGGALGLIPATHQAMIAAVTPIVLPSGIAGQLDGRVIRQLKAGSFDIFQLDAMAYPGSSGSPLYDSHTGDVVGVISMTLARWTKEATLPQPTGIAFAVPAEHLRALLTHQK